LEIYKRRTASIADQLDKDRQGIQVHMRHSNPTAGSTCSPVKHPYRDFQKPVRPAVSEIASKHRLTGLVDHLMDMNQSAKPRMPSIKNLAALDNVGVLACSCTTPSGLTRPSTNHHQTTHSSRPNQRKEQHETYPITS
jgi:hypothetical protein